MEFVPGGWGRDYRTIVATDMAFPTTVRGDPGHAEVKQKDTPMVKDVTFIPPTTPPPHPEEKCIYLGITSPWRKEAEPWRRRSHAWQALTNVLFHPGRRESWLRKFTFFSFLGRHFTSYPFLRLWINWRESKLKPSYKCIPANTNDLSGHQHTLMNFNWRGATSMKSKRKYSWVLLSLTSCFFLPTIHSCTVLAPKK